MPPKIPDKLTDGEKKKIKQANKAKANPIQSAAKSVKNAARQLRRGQIKEALKQDIPLDDEENDEPKTKKNTKK